MNRKKFFIEHIFPDVESESQNSESENERKNLLVDGLHIWSHVENENSESENGKSESSLSKKTCWWMGYTFDLMLNVKVKTGKVR